MGISIIAILVFAAFFVFLSGIRAVPILLFMIHPDFICYRFDDTGAGGELVSTSGALQDWIRRLRELGFFLTGI